MPIRRLLVAVTATLTLSGLSACSDGDQEATANFNKTDVSFAQDMIPHHRQATEMASLAADRTDNPEIRDLASKIIAAQQPEIDLMSDWLKSWGKNVPDSTDMSEMHSDMPGMMGSGDMAELEQSSDNQFDQMFLTMMIRHHEGAIEMAKGEVDNGTFKDAIELARRIQKDQAAEIRTMEKLIES